MTNGWKSTTVSTTDWHCSVNRFSPRWWNKPKHISLLLVADWKRQYKKSKTRWKSVNTYSKLLVRSIFYDYRCYLLNRLSRSIMTLPTRSKIGIEARKRHQAKRNARRYQQRKDNVDKGKLSPSIFYSESLTLLDVTESTPGAQSTDPKPITNIPIVTYGKKDNMNKDKLLPSIFYSDSHNSRC